MELPQYSKAEYTVFDVSIRDSDVLAPRQAYGRILTPLLHAKF